MRFFSKLFKPEPLVEIAKRELYRAEHELLSARVNMAYCESTIKYYTERIEHLQKVVGVVA